MSWIPDVTAEGDTVALLHSGVNCRGVTPETTIRLLMPLWATDPNVAAPTVLDQRPCSPVLIVNAYDSHRVVPRLSPTPEKPVSVSSRREADVAAHGHWIAVCHRVSTLFPGVHKGTRLYRV